MSDSGRQSQALVFGGDTLSFLAVIRSLGRKGVCVHVAGAVATSPTLRSRYVHKVHHLPSFDQSRDSWCEALQAILATCQFDIVIPCDDPHILRFLYYTSKYGAVKGLELLPVSILEVTSSKQRSLELAQNLGIPVANSHLVTSQAELASVLGAIRPPVVLKPLTSFDARDTAHRREVRKAFTHADAAAIGAALLEHGAIQIQENFVGTGTGVEFLASNGRILCAFQHIRLHEPLHGGGSSYRKSIPLDHRMLRSTEALVQALRYDGAGMVEFKWNLRTDAYVFVEINARFWGSLPLAIASGADFPWFLYRYRTEGDTSFPRSFEIGVCCRNLTLDFDWLKANARNSRSDPLLATKPWPNVVAELGSIFLGRERIDTLTLDDPRPLFHEVVQLFVTAIGAAQRKLRRRVRSNGIVRRVRMQRLERVLRRASTVEFVCYGNICRSPFAAETLSGGLTRAGYVSRVGSSGFHTVESRRAPEAAVVAAKEFGVDITEHRSRRVTRDIIEHADAVIVFDWSNFEQLSREFPQARNKAFLMGELDLYGPLTIQDPYGHNPGFYRCTYGNISRLIEHHLLPRLAAAKGGR